MNIHILKGFINPRTSIRQCVLTVAANAILAFAPSAAGEILPVPADLNPGDQYRLVFVTSTETYGWKGANASAPQSIADYNAFATTTATAVPALSSLATL